MTNDANQPMAPHSRNAGGVDYLVGTHGSWVLACDTGCPTSLRLEVPEIESCVYCGQKRGLVRIDELDSKWRPLWAAFDAG
jgi:hypothetical protein